MVPPRFYFGAMSPYSWLAAERIEALLPEARWRAVFAGAIFNASGRSSWGLGEERGERMADCEARAEDYGLAPIRWPAPWPTSDLLIARAMTFVSRAGASTAATPTARSDEESLRRLALAAMRLAFLEGGDLGEADTVLEAADRAGLDRRELREALADPEIKQALRESTDEALGLGVFGVPTVAVEAQLYWGDDRLREAATAYRSRQSA
jgi:2-hydroxychromene-2-carboxylate isomerase